MKNNGEDMKEKEDSLNCKQGYFAMFWFLSKYNESTKLDDLGSMLGSMDPFLFSGGMPIDITMYDSWVEIFDDRSNTIEDRFGFMIKYVEVQEKEFVYDFESLLKFLNDILSNKNEHKKEWTEWINYCKLAQEKI